MKHPWIEQLEMIVRERWWQGLMGVLGLVLALQLYSWTSTLMDFNRINNLISQAEDLSLQDGENNKPENQNNQPQQPIKNIFKKEQEQYQLTGILMDYAIINGQNVKVGDKAGKAEVKEIGMDYVVIQEEGKDQTRTLTLFKGGHSGSSRGSARPPRQNRERPNRQNKEKRSGRNVSSAPPPAPVPMQGDSMPIQMSGMGMGIVIDGQNVPQGQIQSLQFSESIIIER